LPVISTARACPSRTPRPTPRRRVARSDRPGSEDWTRGAGGMAMAEWSDTRTSITLLEKLQKAPKDAVAWERFVWRYRPMICGWCREWGLQGADAEDVAQDVLAKLTEKLGQFHYDPSRCFRAWLKTITQRAWSDEISGRYRGSDSRIIQRLES